MEIQPSREICRQLLKNVAESLPVILSGSRFSTRPPYGQSAFLAARGDLWSDKRRAECFELLAPLGRVIEGAFAGVNARTKAEYHAHRGAMLLDLLHLESRIKARGWLNG